MRGALTVVGEFLFRQALAQLLQLAQGAHLGHNRSGNFWGRQVPKHHRARRPAPPGVNGMSRQKASFDGKPAPVSESFTGVQV